MVAGIIVEELLLHRIAECCVFKIGIEVVEVLACKVTYRYTAVPEELGYPAVHHFHIAVYRGRLKPV